MIPEPKGAQIKIVIADTEEYLGILIASFKKEGWIQSNLPMIRSGDFWVQRMYKND